LQKEEKLQIQLVKKSKIKKWSQTKVLAKAWTYLKNADIVYTRWIYAGTMAALLRKKLIIELHSLHSEQQHDQIRKIFNSEYTHKVIFITENLKAAYEDIFGKSEKFYVEAGAANVVKDSLGDRFIAECGYIGSFYQGKGIEIICEIAKRMKRIKFHIIGGSQEQISEYKQKYELGDNVIWYGYRPYNEAMELMEKFDIALLPNQPHVFVGRKDIGEYTSPNKMFEYMARAKVIIASDVSAIREIIQDGYNGFLVPHDNIDAWVETITQIMDGNKEYEQVRKNAAIQVNCKYNWDDRSRRILG
jgi:glycosyltransferase involved in cell wall biosynthesis